LGVAKSLTGLLGRSMQRSNYAYANARVRVRRSKLLARDSYAKLLKMDIPEITRSLEGTTYSREIDELATKFRGIDLLESALNVNEERDYAEIRAFTKGEVGVLVERYLERFAHWNLKTILRGRSWGASTEEILRELLIEDRANFEFYNGLIHAEGEGMRAVVDALAGSPEGKEYHRILKAAEDKASDPDLLLQFYEDGLDRAYYANLLESIRPDTQENRLFLQFVRKEVDAENLQVLLRLRGSSPEGFDVMDHLLPAGYELKVADLRRLAEASSLEDLVERIKEFEVYQEIKAELDALKDGDSLTPVLIGLKRTVGDFAQRFAYRNPLSVLPIINYLMRKNLEVRNLRAIARGKQAGLEEDEIERLLVVI
jgi:V/A-type H+-transporting ATPase subunit C